MTNRKLNEWYGRQPFDNVEKITGVDIWGHREAEFIDLETEPDEISRDQALDEARKVWNSLSVEMKQMWFDQIGVSF